MKSMEYVKNEFEHIVGGIDKFLIIFDGLRLKYRSGLGCSPFPERKYFNSNRGVYYFVHPTGDALLNVTGDWLSKRNLKNVSVLSDGSLLSPVDPARAFSVLDEVAVNVNTYLEFNNTSNSKNPDIGYDKFASTLSGRTLFASRLFFVTGRPDFLAYAISEAYKLGRVDDEHLWISTGLPEINVAFELLNTLSNVKQAFRSLYFVQSSMEENFALPGNLDEDTKKELGKNMDR